MNNNPLNATDPTGMFISLVPPKDSGDDGGYDSGDPCFLCFLPRCILCFGPGGGAPAPEPPSPPVKFTVTVTANPPKNKVCPAVPSHPDNASADANAREERLLRLFLPPFKEALFYLDVRNGSKWDYKQQGQTLDDFGRWQPSPYQDFGNFNFGVVGAAAGIPQQELLRAAGAAQTQAKTSNPRFGHWYDLHPPYGDDPNDQVMIRAGYTYYQNGCVQ